MRPKCSLFFITDLARGVGLFLAAEHDQNVRVRLDVVVPHGIARHAALGGDQQFALAVGQMNQGDAPGLAAFCALGGHHADRVSADKLVHHAAFCGAEDRYLQACCPAHEEPHNGYLAFLDRRNVFTPGFYVVVFQGSVPS